MLAGNSSHVARPAIFGLLASATCAVCLDLGSRPRTRASLRVPGLSGPAAVDVVLTVFLGFLSGRFFCSTPTCVLSTWSMQLVGPGVFRARSVLRRRAIMDYWDRGISR